MAVYCDLKLETDFTTVKNDCMWHNDYGLLAITSNNDQSVGEINIYSDDGDLLQSSVIRRLSIVTCIQWHPCKKVLVAGWESGEIVLHTVDCGEIHEVGKVHQAPISHLAYTCRATYLASADKSGVVVIWKSDVKGHIQAMPLHKVCVNQPITQILYRNSISSDKMIDIAKIAKAAVSGDESALDMFSWKDNNLNLASSFKQTDSPTFFVAEASGGVYCISHSELYHLLTVNGTIKTLLYNDKKGILLTMTDSLSLTQFQVVGNAEAEEINKVRLSGKGKDSQVIWTRQGLLAISTSDTVIRMLDIDKGGNYFLSLLGHSSYSTTEIIVCIAYCAVKGILAAGTNMGNIAMWTYSSNEQLAGSETKPESLWKLHTPSTLEGPISQLRWGTSRHLLAANTSHNVYVLSEQMMNVSYSDEICVVQVAPCQLTIDVFSTNGHHDLKTDIQIKGLYTTQDALAIWNGKKIVVYEYATDKSVMSATGSFVADTMTVCMYEQSLFTLEHNKVQIRTFQGTVKQTLSFSEVEGLPVHMNVCSAFLVIATDTGLLKLFDISRREAKLHSSPKQMTDLVEDFGSIASVKCNCTGSRISVLVNKRDGKPHSKLYILDIEMDVIHYFDFSSGLSEQDESAMSTTTTDHENDTEHREKLQKAQDVSGHYPVSHFWDSQEPKLLVCEAHFLESFESLRSKSSASKVSSQTSVRTAVAEKIIVALFSTSENGILVQGSYSLSTDLNCLIGIHVPYHYFLKRAADEDREKVEGEYNDAPPTTILYPKMVTRQVMSDFVGLEECDKTTRDAMINFSFHLAIGDMDEAFKAIRLIKSEAVWENMAKMCVKSRRLNVASVCLGKMAHARGAMMLRAAMKEPELDAKVAVLAIQLGLYEDAERLLKNCQRYDLLNRYYQASGKWNLALETAEIYDRIHLRTTYYNFAKSLEENGDISTAIPNYEKSDTHRFEVPRMLCDDPHKLETYVMKNSDPDLKKWWAQYLESTGEMQKAISCYETAQDYLSLVRVYCYCDNIDKAAEICNETGNQAACYHLARQYERIGKIQEAINFYSRAQAYGNAIQLCKEYNYDDQILNLSLLAKPGEMMDAARYFEQFPHHHEKAIMLYHKAGNFSKALELSFQSKEFGALQLISNQLDEKTNPALLQRCADFFLQNYQYDKAVELLGLGRQYNEAIKVCLSHHIDMTEELAEKLTPSKEDEDYSGVARNQILEAIADVAMQQGHCHVATKKFTQAGNKIKAMKALLKSGDTDKIIFFAGVSRQREIYIMAANYLQSLDWRQDPEIMKHIIGFYTKGRALDSLALFYEVCSQIEIDEYRNYEKALSALGEAVKCLMKLISSDSDKKAIAEQKVESYKIRIDYMEKFISATSEYSSNPDKSVKTCQSLLNESDIDRSVRIGDLYTLIITYHCANNDWKEAYGKLEKMKKTIPINTISQYLGSDTVGQILNKMGIASSTRSLDGQDDEVEENVLQFA